MAKSNPFRFSTKYQDDESELLYYGYRFYNASTGRWLSRDPKGEKGGRNLLAFCRNNPMNKADPIGLEEGTWVLTGQSSASFDGRTHDFLRYTFSELTTESVFHGQQDVVIITRQQLRDGCSCVTTDTHLVATLHSTITFQWMLSRHYVDGGLKDETLSRDVLSRRNFYRRVKSYEVDAVIRLGASAQDCPNRILFERPAPYFPGYEEEESIFE